MQYNWFMSSSYLSALSRGRSRGRQGRIGCRASAPRGQRSRNVRFTDERTRAEDGPFFPMIDWRIRPAGYSVPAGTGTHQSSPSLTPTTLLFLHVNYLLIYSASESPGKGSGRPWTPISRRLHLIDWMAASSRKQLGPVREQRFFSASTCVRQGRNECGRASAGPGTRANRFVFLAGKRPLRHCAPLPVLLPYRITFTRMPQRNWHWTGSRLRSLAPPMTRILSEPPVKG